jgi:fluoroacetyl-CoA thioesterase
VIHSFKSGDKKYFTKIVVELDSATFDTGAVHPVYATFALGRDAEWVCRLFVLEMKEEDEEGIGTFLKIEHLSPAVLNSQVIFEATLKAVEGNSVLCSFEARVGDRLIAKGETGQKVLKKEKLEMLFNNLVQ